MHWLLALTLVSGCGPRAPADPGPDPGTPSIVLVTIDALRADHLGLYGYPRQTAPFLDSLAQTATVFTAAFRALLGT